MDSSSNEFLTTGEVAKVMGVTRQHVRNLCDRGLLPVTYVGAHRRVRQSDLDNFMRASQEPTRDQLRNLWLHQAVAGKLVMRPETTIEVALRNLEMLREVHPRGPVTKQFDEWESLLKGSRHELLNALTSISQRSNELRQNSPFAGVLTENERSKVLANFRTCSKRSA